ncbi:MAG TPA: hypothetical protein VEG30_14100 [Terriglobales bacterium]|nr:hypothetical protein [Terriglobales bacterium]
MQAGWWREVTLALCLGGFLTGGLAAQEGAWQGQKDHPRLRATLQDKDKNAKNHAAVVEVETQNVGLVDVGAPGYGGNDVGILEYQIDQDPPVVTEDTRVMFRDLSSGKHTVTVSLLNTQYKEMGAKAKLDVEVP